MSKIVPGCLMSQHVPEAAAPILQPRGDDRRSRAEVAAVDRVAEIKGLQKKLIRAAGVVEAETVIIR
jgi:hypothetical protein